MKSANVVLALSAGLSIALTAELAAIAIAAKSVQDDGARVRIGGIGTFPLRLGGDDSGAVSVLLPPTAEASLSNMHTIALLAGLTAAAIVLLG